MVTRIPAVSALASRVEDPSLIFGPGEGVVTIESQCVCPRVRFMASQ